MTPRRDPDFEVSADMRLIELQRAALGVPAPVRGAWESSSGTEGSVAPAEAEPVLASAVVACDLTATPPGDVIPGAVITLALSIANEGAIPAHNLRACVPVPGGAAYRPGTFVRDGREQDDQVAERLFSTGIEIPELLPRARATFVWKIGVRSGNKALVVAPSVSAEDAAVVGLQPLLVSRREGAQATFAAEVLRVETTLAPPEPLEAIAGELPIYELDEEEIIEHEAAEAALSSTAEYQPGIEPPLQPAMPPPDQPEPLPPPAQPFPVPEPGTPTVEPEIPPPPEQPPEIEPAAREAIVLLGQIDRPSIAYFERIFTGGKPPTLLNHFILGGALACTRTPDGNDPAGLKTHLDAQAQLLQRIVLHEKLGKKEPIAEYAGSMLAHVEHLSPKPVPPLTAPEDKNNVLLQAEIDTPSLVILTRMQEESARWDFTKARQLTLALQARNIIAAAPQTAVDNANAALRSYAQTASTQLQRFFVRMRLDRTTGLLFANDETLDAAARTLIAALIALF